MKISINKKNNFNMSKKLTKIFLVLAVTSFVIGLITLLIPTCTPEFLFKIFGGIALSFMGLSMISISYSIKNCSRIEKAYVRGLIHIFASAIIAAGASLATGNPLIIKILRFFFIFTIIKMFLIVVISLWIDSKN